MSDTPPNTITLQEACIRCFRSQLPNAILPELSPAPELAGTGVLNLRQRPRPTLRFRNKDERAPALQWWRGSLKTALRRPACPSS